MFEVRFYFTFFKYSDMKFKSFNKLKIRICVVRILKFEQSLTLLIRAEVKDF